MASKVVTKESDELVAQRRLLRLLLKKGEVPIPPLSNSENETLSRFLVARNGEVTLADAMIRDAVAFRKKHINEPKLLSEFKAPDVLLKYLPSKFFHLKPSQLLHDRHGNLIKYKANGSSDPSGLLSALAYDIDLLQDFVLFEAEHVVQTLRAMGQRQGKPAKLVVVDDLAGLCSRHATAVFALRTFAKFGTVLADNYPEMLHSIVLINAPLVFTAIWAVLQPLIPERTKTKIVVLGTDFLPALLERIDASQIPASIGGLAEVDMPRVGCVPADQLEGSSLGYRKVAIQRRGSAKESRVLCAGARCVWRWRALAYDCACEVRFEPAGTAGGDTVVVSPSERGVEGRGCFTAPSGGTLHLQLDNQFSMMRGKEVLLLLQVQ